LKFTKVKEEIDALLKKMLPFEGGEIEYESFEGGEIAKVGNAPLAEASSGGSGSSLDSEVEGEMPTHAIEGHDAPANTIISKQFICEVDQKFTCAM
jgi:hypothetical protein